MENLRSPEPLAVVYSLSQLLRLATQAGLDEEEVRDTLLARLPLGHPYATPFLVESYKLPQGELSDLLARLHMVDFYLLSELL